MAAIDLTPAQQLALLRILHTALDDAGFVWVEAWGEYTAADVNPPPLTRDPGEWLSNLLGAVEGQLQAQQREEGGR